MSPFMHKVLSELSLKKDHMKRHSITVVNEELVLQVTLDPLKTPRCAVPWKINDLEAQKQANHTTTRKQESRGDVSKAGKQNILK